MATGGGITFLGMTPLELRQGSTPQLIVSAAMKTALTKSAYVVQNAAKVNAPVDTGRLRASITYRLDASVVPLWADVGTKVVYAQWVHDGRAAGSRMPPPAALAVWAQRHGGMNPYVLARAIGRRGIRAKPFLRDALHSNSSAIRGYLQAAGADIVARWNAIPR